MTDTTEPPPDDPLDMRVALKQLQDLVTDHHVAILKLQAALTYLPCPFGRTTADVAAPDVSALAAEEPRPLNVEECLEYGLCNCAVGIATEPLKLGQAPVP